MTRKNTAGKTGAETYFDQFKRSFEAIQGQIEVPAAAREFVQRGAVNARERADTLHAGATDAASSAEKLATAFVGGYANVARDIVDVTFDNVRHGFETIEKLAGAKTVGDALEVQSDFVRERAKANYERFSNAAETARKAVSDGTEQLRAEFVRVNPYFGKAA